MAINVSKVVQVFVASLLITILFLAAVMALSLQSTVLQAVIFRPQNGAQFPSQQEIFFQGTAWDQKGQSWDWSKVEFEWDFGDGTKSFAQNPHHIYCKPGRYTVTLTVRLAGEGGRSWRHKQYSITITIVSSP